MTEQDEHNYSSSSPHRLPTYSASSTLGDAATGTANVIKTELSTLDAYLQGKSPEAVSDGYAGGISKGEVTEIYGPPGAGKTTFCLQLACSELKQGNAVVWVDTSSNFVSSRLNDMLAHGKDEQSGADQQLETSWDKLHHFRTPSLLHLLALLAQPSESFPPDNTGLVVIDTISSLFSQAYPKRFDYSSIGSAPQKKHSVAQWASGRRWAVMNDLISKVAKLAAIRNIAVVLCSQMTTKIRADTGAFLYPAMSGATWDGTIGNRIVIFRDWLTRIQGRERGKQDANIRFAGVLKAKGVVHDGIGKTLAFTIDKIGLHEVALDESTIDFQRPISPVASTTLKRKRDDGIGESSQSGAEDSDDEYGWQAEDETLQADGFLD